MHSHRLDGYHEDHVIDGLHGFYRFHGHHRLNGEKRIRIPIMVSALFWYRTDREALMANVTFEQLKKKDADSNFIRGTSKNGKIEKDAHFYHVITRSWGGETIFYSEIGQYRNRLLCKLCSDRGITILFSVSMPNHTHDVFMTENWQDLATVMRLLNSQLGHYIRTRSKRTYPDNWKIFDYHITYVAIRDIATLFYIGKYIYDNPAYLTDSNRKTPFTCFWMISNGHIPSSGYDRKIYEKLFLMTAEEVCDFYRKHTKQEVSHYSKQLASGWTEEDTNKTFYRK